MTKVPARKPIFVGCEGASERSYVTFLKRLAKDAGLHVHLETRDLGGGDAKSALERARTEFKEYCKVTGRKTPGYVLLDTDRTGGQREAIEASAQKDGLTIIWQDPCHEALLLRHFDGEEHRQPHDCAAAMHLLCQHWPTYQKNIPAVRIPQTLAIGNVRRAAGVTPRLLALLQEINL